MAPTPDSQPLANDQPAPRFLRFMTALVLGTAVTAIPCALAGCDGGGDPPTIDASASIDASVDAIDAGPIDGPLPPPDLARVA